MEEKSHWLPTSIGMFILACLFLGLTLAIYPGVAVVGVFFDKNIKIDWEGDAPAWSQFISSLVAIAVAIFVPYKIQKNSVIERKRDEFEKAVIKFRYVTDRLNSLIRDIYGHAGIIAHQNSLESHIKIWSKVYIDTFARHPLPSPEDIEILRHLSFRQTVNLMMNVSALKSMKDSLLNAQSTYKIFSEENDDEVVHFGGVISIINQNISFHKNSMGRVIFDFEEVIRAGQK